MRRATNLGSLGEGDPTLRSVAWPSTTFTFKADYTFMPRNSCEAHSAGTEFVAAQRTASRAVSP